MAARENQGYLVAVIVLVLMVLLLGILAFFGISKANEHYEGLTKAQSDLNIERKVREANQITGEVLRAYVGDQGEKMAEVATKLESLNRIANDSSLTDAQRSAVQNVVTQLNDVRTTYNRDMQQFIARTDDDQTEELTWSGVVRNLIAVTANKHNELEVARRRNEQDQLDFANKLAAQQKALDETQKLLDTTLNDLRSEQRRNQDKEASLIADLQKAQDEIRQAGQRNENAQNILRRDNNRLAETNDQLAEENNKLRTRITALTQEHFDLHDGTVSRVARAGGLVFLDIGSADGLRTNQTFSVYDKSVTNFEKNQEKAKIEVIRVTGPHTSDARITEENPVDPINRYDVVVTPTWNRGYSVPIALAGIFDLDGDGHSDRLQLIRMIEKNGGTVIAQNDEQGEITGKIDSSTGLLVMGSPPKLGPDESSSRVFGAMRELENQAKSASIPIIDLRKLLNWMGEHNRAQVDHFQTQIDNSRLDDFRSRSLLNGKDSSTQGSSTR